ncbi:MAG: flagellar export protein FliJ [Opitutae bacterium]|nr:flagellar export protein FliJ [Opitutae bacterium]
MKRFRFPLRPVAVLRAHRQARAREAFAQAVHLYVEAEQRHAAVRARREELETVMHDGRRATFRAADEIAFWGAYRHVCEEEIRAERAVIETRAAMETRREEYLAAHRAVKVVEKLEQKARALHRRLTGRAEMAELDELAGFRRARQPATANFT